MTIVAYVGSIGWIVELADFGYFLFLFEEHLLVLLYEVLFALKLLVVIGIRIVYLLVDLN